jgi:hypothetical protein
MYLDMSGGAGHSVFSIYRDMSGCGGHGGTLALSTYLDQSIVGHLSSRWWGLWLLLLLQPHGFLPHTLQLLSVTITNPSVTFVDTFIIVQATTTPIIAANTVIPKSRHATIVL